MYLRTIARVGFTPINARPICILGGVARNGRLRLGVVWVVFGSNLIPRELSTGRLIGELKYCALQVPFYM